MPAAWDDRTQAWDSYDALVMRSTWNYHTSLDAFQSWLDRVESLELPIWNPPAILRWNASKTYLRARLLATSVCREKPCAAGCVNCLRPLLHHPLPHPQATWPGSSAKSSNCAWSVTS